VIDVPDAVERETNVAIKHADIRLAVAWQGLDVSVTDDVGGSAFAELTPETARELAGLLVAYADDYDRRHGKKRGAA
jgi:hypothetical protein